MVDSVSNNGSFSWDSWLQSEMPGWNDADTKVFMKNFDSSINAFQSEVKKLHEDNKKATDEILKQDS